MATDQSGHLYHEVASVARVTYIPVEDRAPDADWAGEDVIRIQAYRGGETEHKALHRGAEIPVGEPEGFIELISKLCELYNEGRAHSK